MSYEVEAFREDVDDLTAKLLGVVLVQTSGQPAIDRSIILSAALANVACYIDGDKFDEAGVTGRVSRIADMWRGR